MKLNDQDRLVSVRETATLLGCSVATVWRKAADGQIPTPIKLGGLTRWSQTELLSCIEAAAANREAA